MTTNEIKAWARYAAMEQECHGKLVLLRKEDGLFLQDDGTWAKGKQGARRFHFDRDQVRGQIEEVESRFGVKWEAVAI